MALWDSNALLASCKLRARRPAIDAAMPDPSWFALMTDAQPEVFSDLFTRYPNLQYSAAFLMTSPDSGATYYFGVDAAGDPIRPMGHAEIYPALTAIPDSPLRLGIDFMFEGSLIRMPSSRTRSFPGGPYARFVARPDTAIDATHQPILFPKNARMLLVWKALEYWASRPGSGASPVYYMRKYEEARTMIWTELATEYNGQGADGLMVDSNPWWSIGSSSADTGTIVP